MKKAQEESLIRKTVKASMETMKKIVLGNDLNKTVEEIKDDVEGAIKFTKQKIDDFIKDLTSRFFSILLLISGIIIALLGVALFLVDYVKVPRSISYIVTGMIIIFIGWIGSRKNENF